MSKLPRLAIGLPVYNGENFLAETLDSLLGQSFSDFLIVICDNASTDGTGQICLDYASRDARITYWRNPKNIGAGPNYREVFHRAPACELFKWAAHDDLYDPDYLARCIARLDADQDMALCHSRTASIDPAGEIINRWPARPDLESSDPAARFGDVLRHRDTYCIWGVMRRAALAATPLLGDYPAHDRPLLAEMALHGKMGEIDDFLFFDREHPNRSVRAFDASKPHLAAVWYDPRNSGKLMFPDWRLLWEYGRAIQRAPISGAVRIGCLKALGEWAKVHRPELVGNLVQGAERLPVAGSAVSAVKRRGTARAWNRRTLAAAAEIGRQCDAGDKVLLVDAGEVDANAFSAMPTLPFSPQAEAWQPVPANDSEAFAALERGRAAGATLIGFLWPTFWWWDHYHDFMGHVERDLPCLARTDNVALFRLDPSSA